MYTFPTEREIRWLKRTVALVGLLMLLAGCAVGPKYVKPTVAEPTAWSESQDPALGSGQADLSRWWTVFDDPVLDSLIEKAYANNPGLQAAGIRILEARAQLGIASGALYPQVQQLRGDLGAVGGSETAANTTSTADLRYGETSLGFDAAWELDFWGKFRKAVAAGVGNLDASIASYDDILVTLTAEVARTYTLIRTLEARLEIARNNVAIQKRSLEIATVRFKGGDVTELDVVQARTLLANTQAAIPRLDSNLQRSKNALALLLGLFPAEVDAMLKGPLAIPSAPPEVAAGLPADMLRRRPDIRQVERQLLAQNALTGVTQADLYPRLALIGSIGLRSSSADLTAAGFPGGSSLGDLFDASSLEFFAGPTFSWDIFNYGRIKNRVRVQDARFQQLAEAYRNTVLEAVREVEDASVAFLRSQWESKYLQESATAASRSVELAMFQYQEGLMGYQRVLDSQRAQARQQDLLTSSLGDIAVNLVALYKALGGGWEIREGKPFVPETTRKEMAERTDWGGLLEDEIPTSSSPETEQLEWRAPDW